MLKSPLAFSAALYAFQFVVRYLRRPQFVSLIIRAYYRCSPDLCNKAITRDARVGAENLIEFIERQMKDLSRQVPKFTQGKLEPAILGRGQAAYSGYKFDVSYRQNARTVYHVQSIFGDEATPKTMGFSFSSHVPITDEQRSLIAQILDSYVPHRS